MKVAELPPEVRTQMLRFEQRLRRVETLLAVLSGLVGLLGSYVLLFFSDRLWDTPAALRTLMLLGGALAVGLGARYWLLRWWWRPRSTRELARLVQHRYRGMGDRLLGLVELAAQRDARPDNISPMLLEAAIRQAGREVSKYDFAGAVETRRPRRLSLWLTGLVVVSGALVLSFPQAGFNAFQRWLKPMSAIERFTFVSLEDLPNELVVPYSEEFPLTIGLRPSSLWAPPKATLRVGDQLPLAALVADRRAHFSVPGQTQALPLSISIGDANRTILLRPTHRPALRQLEAEVRWPSYLQRPPARLPVAGAGFTGLAGAEVVLHGVADRPLARASLSGGETGPVTVTGNTFSTSPLPVGASQVWALSWEDTLGLAVLKPRPVTLDSREDLPPRVEILEQARSTAILVEETLEIRARADDDFGLLHLTLYWEQTPMKGEAGASAQNRVPLAEGGPELVQLSGSFHLAPRLLDIPEQTIITLYAETTDYLPKREPVRTELYRVFVLSRAEHAKLVMREFDKLMGRLEELARREEDLLAGKESLKSLPETELNNSESAEKLREQALDEAANTSELERLAREGMELLKEAMRNQDFTPETLREWSQMMEAMRQMSQQEMQQMMQALKQARQQQGEQRKQELSKAIEKQEEVLEKLRQLQKQAERNTEEMAARNFAARLREVAKEELNIRRTLERLLGELVGVTAAELPESRRTQLEGLAEDQRDARTETRYIMEDLAGFFTRTRIEKYDQVYQAMRQALVLDALEKLTADIAENQTVKVIGETEKWAKTFNQWADMLAKPKDGGGGGGGGGGQELSAEQMELLMRLMRIALGEAELRGRTRALDRYRAEDKNYPEKAVTLHDDQLTLREVLGGIMDKISNPQALQLLGQAEAAMLDAAGLLRKPDTGAPTIAAETEVIELLLAGTNQEAQGMGASAAAMAQMMMEMMGMGGMPGMGQGQGQSGGGSTAGGLTDRPNDPLPGDNKGERVTGSQREGVAGSALSRVPQEFRDVLQSYFGELEGKQR